MNPIIELVSGYLKEHELEPTVENNIITLRIKATNGSWPLMADLSEDGEILTVVSAQPLMVPEKLRGSFALEMAKMNFGQRVGAWHFNLEEGTILFCVSVPSAAITSENVKRVLDVIFGVTNSSMDGMLGRLAGKAFSAGTEALVKPEARFELN